MHAQTETMGSPAAGEPTLAAKMGIASADWELRKRFVQFTERDAALLRELQPIAEQHAEEVVDAFYRNIRGSDHLMRVIEQAGSTVDRLKVTQAQYLIELFSGEYGLDYVERRLRIGVMHHRIGLSPQWYLGSYAVYTQALLPVVRRHFRWSSQRREEALMALQKLLSLDAQLAIDTYIHALVGDLESVTLSKEEVDRDIAEYRRYVARVATGDLTSQLEVRGDDELASLGDQLNHMTGNLAEMAKQINDAAGSMTAAVGELQQTSNSQSAGAAQQASAVNETATTLEEIRATSGQTREKAKALSQSAERTREEGERGLAVVERTIGAMREIREKVESIARNILALSEQTQQIGEITDLVSGLAQQLKILALNASIEAGKVGEAGRGFGVVAGEVRNLAEQSQEATSQIHSILHDIQRATDRSVMATEEGTKGVDQGMQLVEQSGSAMRDLTRVIRETALAGQQIVAAVSQEAAGIDQIAAAMKDINGATNQFLAATQQTKLTSEKLSELAKGLRERAAVYKTR